MNDELHNKVVKFFYDHEELFIAIMNKTPYQSDGWDYEIEVVKEFLTANQSCYCGDIYNLGVIHRDDGPCHYPNDKEPEPEPVAWIHTKIEGVAVPHRPADLDKYPDRWEALYKVPPPCPTCEALAQSEQEPVAKVESVATVVSESGNQEVTMSWWHEPALPIGTKLYTTPPQRKPLTDEEIEQLFPETLSDDGLASYWLTFARAIEAAHGIKE